MNTYYRSILKREPINRWGRMGYREYIEIVRTDDISKYNYRKRIKFHRVSEIENVFISKTIALFILLWYNIYVSSWATPIYIGLATANRGEKMKLKNHKIYTGNVNLYIPFQFNLYVIKCNHIVFNELTENISADIKSVCLYQSGDTMIEIEHKQKNVRLILKAFKMGLKIYNILDKEVKQVDFLSKIF